MEMNNKEKELKSDPILSLLEFSDDIDYRSHVEILPINEFVKRVICNNNQNKNNTQTRDNSYNK